MAADLRTGWIDSPAFDLHTNGRNHPERRERLLAVREGIAAQNLESKLERVLAKPVARDVLERVHPASHVQNVEVTCAEAGRFDGDTAVVPASWDAALAAAGAVVQGVDGVMSKRWQRAFCSVRPPGHHALAAQAMGFCVFDNVAVGAQHALHAHGLKRVAILDWDVHHGNGTEAIFWERGDVMYTSIHQYPFYPGTGALEHTGSGAGAGCTINCPVAEGQGDEAYMQAWETRIRPGLEAFAPELLLISAGFDADARDPLAQLNVTASGITKLSEHVVRWADAHCAGRIVSVLEGGYHLDALRENAALHVGTLC